MTAELRRHTFSRADVEAIADPLGTGHVARTLVAAERSKHMLLVRAALDLTRSSPAASRAAFAYDVLSKVGRLAPQAADSVICHPEVGAWAMTLLRGRGPGDPGPPSKSRTALAADGLASMAAAAAVIGRVDARIDLPATSAAVPEVALPTLGYATFAEVGDRARIPVMTMESARARITLAGSQVGIPADPRTAASRWHPSPYISAQSNGRVLTLQLDDQSPHRNPGRVTEPDRLLPAAIAAWQEIVERGWEILTCHHQAIAADIAEMIKILSPLRAVPGSQFSVTARDSFGAIALSKPADDLTMAVTLVHELQHTKLMALEDLFPLLLDQADQRRFYAPWRDDPRPLSGLLQGTFAYFGVSGFWRRQRSYEEIPSRLLRAHTEFARWRAACRDAVSVLRYSGGLSAHGRVVVSVMAKHLDRWCTDPVPDVAVLAARDAACKHRLRWIGQHGPMSGNA